MEDPADLNEAPAPTPKPARVVIAFEGKRYSWTFEGDVPATTLILALEVLKTHVVGQQLMNARPGVTPARRPGLIVPQGHGAF